MSRLIHDNRVFSVRDNKEDMSVMSHETESTGAKTSKMQCLEEARTGYIVDMSD